jgi:hypothetical protein
MQPVLHKVCSRVCSSGGERYFCKHRVGDTESHAHTGVTLDTLTSPQKETSTHTPRPRPARYIFSFKQCPRRGPTLFCRTAKPRTESDRCGTVSGHGAGPRAKSDAGQTAMGKKRTSPDIINQKRFMRCDAKFLINYVAS